MERNLLKVNDIEELFWLLDIIQLLRNNKMYDWSDKLKELFERITDSKITFEKDKKVKVISKQKEYILTWKEILRKEY